MTTKTKTKSDLKTALMEAVISDRTWKGQQSYYRERIVQRGEYRLRYYLRCDSYTFQSYADVDVWRDLKWNNIHRIAGEQMKSGEAYGRHINEASFDEDIAELCRVALAILGVS